MQDTNLTKRIFLATFISMLFFVAYSYFIVPPAQATADINKTKESAPSVEKKENQIAPKVTQTKQSVLTVITSDTFIMKIDELGRISSFVLQNAIFDKEEGKHLELLGKTLPKPLEIRFSDTKLNTAAFNTKMQTDKPEVTLKETPVVVTFTQDLGELQLTKVLTVRKDGSYQVDVSLSKEASYFISNGFRPNVEVNMYTNHGVLVKSVDGTIDIMEDGEGENKTYENATIASSMDQYYATLFYAPQGFKVIQSVDQNKNPILFVEGKKEFSVLGYIGPKYVSVFKALHPELEDAIDYGIMTFMAKPLFIVLKWAHGFVGSWGVAIIILTILIKILLFPLSYKGMVSMYKLKELAPKLREIQKKYKGDPQKLQMNMMKLYKENGANPLGGCLPILLQVPFFFAIYKLLMSSTEIKGADFLWISDIGLMDPYYILPILMGVSMFIQQSITPSNFQDPVQEKIFKFMPVIFIFFFITFPAGLVLYWTINNVLQIGQQFIINKVLKVREEAKKAIKK